MNKMGDEAGNMEGTRPDGSVPEARSNAEIETWRRTIFQRSQYLMLVIGVFVSAITITQAGADGADVMSGTIPGWLLMGVSLVWKSPGTRIRAWLFLCGFLWVAIAVVVAQGFLVPNPFVGTTFLCCLAALILGKRAAWLAVATTVLALIAVSFHHVGSPPLEGRGQLDTSHFNNWIRVVANYAVLASATTGSVLFLVSRLERSLTNSQELLRALEQETADKMQAIDERHQLEQQLAHSQRLECLGRLAGGIAHDFNNLLTVIAGNALLAKTGSDLDEERNQALEDISTATKRAANLTGQLLAFSRRQSVDPEPIDVAESVATATNLVKRLLPSSIKLQTTIAPDLPFVRGVPTAVSQIVMNLAINARDAMDRRGTITIEVTSVEKRRDGKEARFVRLRIVDDGPGMQPEAATRAFEPFFTTKPPGEGTGLGLSLVASLAKQCGGWVELHTRPGEGARFDVHLEARSGNQEPGSQEPPESGTSLILMVDERSAGA